MSKLISILLPRPYWALVVLSLVVTGCAGSGEVAERSAPAADAATETVAEAPVDLDFPPTPVDLDNVEAGRFDSGKMWTFDYPPIDYFNEAYGFAPDEAWFEHARLGALRLPNCTASFVSPNGLAMTNNHCSRGQVVQVQQPGEDLVENGFFASDLADERAVPGWFVDQLIAIEDVTDEVYEALEGEETIAERAAARNAAFQRIQARLSAEAGGQNEGVTVQIVSLYNGGKYSAYTFRRFTDLRLVMTPELQMGYYGGDTDNFTFPRYALDVTFFRVYDGDEPYQPEHYFGWSEEGASVGDPVFVVGNPGSTNRLETTAQLAFRRDVQERTILEFYGSRIAALQSVFDADPNPALNNLIFGLLNSQKAYTGRLAGLEDPLLMARRKDSERDFQEAIETDPALRAEYGDLIRQMAEIQREKFGYGDDYRAFLALPQSGLSSSTLRRAVYAYEYLKRKADMAPEPQVEQALQQLTNVGDQPPLQDELLLASRLKTFVDAFGAGDPLVEAALQGDSPEARAASVIANSVLSTASSTEEAVDDNRLSMDDPAIQLAATFVDRLRAYQSGFQALLAQEAEVAEQLGRARFEVYGTSIPPDATFSLRIADGVVQGYEYNGTRAPAFTTLYGLYDHYYSYGEGRGDGREWDLPESWLNPPETLDLSTPMNLVCTSDIIGGNSGSPLLSKDLEIVGLVFDGNIESLPGSFIFVTDRNRTVAVDARGILEALDEIYDMDRIVLELTQGNLEATESEADAVLGSM